MEESIVDPPHWGAGETGKYPRLRCVQGNLNHRKFMHVIEGGEITAGPDKSVLLSFSPYRPAEICSGDLMRQVCTDRFHMVQYDDSSNYS